MLTDTHCHLDLEQFDGDRAEVLARARQAGIRHILLPGLDLASSQSVVELAETDPMLYAAVGVHPTESQKFSENTSASLRQLAQSPKVVAVGEIGLDYYWKTAPHDLQALLLRQQLDLAADLQLPVILHFREKGDLPGGACARDLLTILESWQKELKARKNPLADRPGVLHSFSGNIETAERAMELNFTLGIGGPVTYNPQRQELVRNLPVDRLLIETDAPFQAPAPHRGKRNEPSFVTLIADKIAALHSMKIEEFTAIMDANARRLFAWED